MSLFGESCCGEPWDGVPPDSPPEVSGVVPVPVWGGVVSVVVVPVSVPVVSVGLGL